MNFSAEIVAGVSIADIKLATRTDEALREIYAEGHVIKENKFNNFDRWYTHYEIDNRIVSLVGDDESGTICRLWCKKPYLGKYKNSLSPGMTVLEICQVTKKQLLIHGVLVPDSQFGIAFNIPYEYEELDYVEQLPPNLILEELHVMNSEWWR